jgi:hypothetical protein
MTWRNTVVYSCECIFCFCLLFHLVNVFLCLLMSEVYWHVSYWHESNAETGSVEWMLAAVLWFQYFFSVFHFNLLTGHDVLLCPRSFTANISWVWHDMTDVLVLWNSRRFFLYEATPTAFCLAANAVHKKYLNHCTLSGLQGGMASSSNSEREICLQKRISRKF